jgi:hypothetical protein
MKVFERKGMRLRAPRQLAASMTTHGTLSEREEEKGKINESG